MLQVPGSRFDLRAAVELCVTYHRSSYPLLSLAESCCGAHWLTISLQLCMLQILTSAPHAVVLGILSTTRLWATSGET